MPNLLLSVLLLQPVADIAAGPMTAHYAVRAHALTGADDTVPVDVRLTIAHPPRGRTVVQMPVWTPGSYRFRDFPDRVRSLTASSPAGHVPVARLNRHTWEVAHGDADRVTIAYRVAIPYASRGMVRGQNRRSITYEGPGLYLLVRDHLDIPCRVRFDLPDDWEVATGLVPTGEREFFAQDYDFLADCPVKLGTFQRFEFRSHGKPIEVIVDGPGVVEFDSATWLGNIKKITDTQGDIFGGFPFDRYVFLYSASPGRGYGGGLEHLTSTMIGISASSLRDNPETGMGVTAHEFVHLWNVKRMRPIELGPFDYTRPNRTPSLWVAEGITSYYTQVTLARCGLTDEAGFWNAMQGAISSIENNPARDHVPPMWSSYRVWEGSAPDRRISYYTSGQVIGLLLDVEIRARTGNRRSLDDFMRALYQRCVQLGRGYRATEVVQVASEVCGEDLTAWFDHYVGGTAVPPYAEILAHAGVKVTERRSRTNRLRGQTTMAGKPGYADPDATGATTRHGVILSIDGEAVESASDIRAHVKELEPGSKARLKLAAVGNLEVTLDADVVSVPIVRMRLQVDPNATPEQRAIREGITGASSK